MSSRNAACPECQMLLQDTGPSGDPWEMQILCPGCSHVYHISCTTLGSEKTWRQLGQYVRLWKCKRCFVEGSEESMSLSERLEELTKLKRSPNPSGDNTSISKGIACAECFKELRDENGRLSRRMQCPQCLGAFHFSCTEVGDERVWQSIGDYRNLWKCRSCFGFDSNKVLINERIKEVKQTLNV